MRKLILLIVMVLLIVTLSGCKGLGEDTKPNDKRFVSAIGFDESGGEIAASVLVVEALGEGKVNSYTLKKRGDNIAVVLSELEAESPRVLSFSHAESIVLGETVSKERISEMLDYFINEEKVPLSTILVATKNSEALLEMKSESDKGLGNEIYDTVEKYSNKTGIAAHTGLYEIKTASMQEVNVFSLPWISTENDRLNLSGLRLYVDNVGGALLDYERSLTYTLIRNIFDGGEIYFENNIYSVSSAKTLLKADFSGDRLKITLTVRGDNAEEIIKILEKTLENTNEDYFGIAPILADSYPEIWKSVKDSYKKHFKNAEIKIVRE